MGLRKVLRSEAAQREHHRPARPIESRAELSILSPRVGAGGAAAARVLLDIVGLPVESEGAGVELFVAEGAGVEAASLRTAGSVDALPPTAGGQQEKGRLKAAAQLVQT